MSQPVAYGPVGLQVSNAVLVPGGSKTRVFLPTELKDHMSFFQVPARRWWKALLGLVAYAACFFMVMVFGVVVMMIADPSMISEAINGRIGTTPSLFVINNISIAADVGVCSLMAWLFFKQGFGWLVSVVGRFRWKWFALTLAVFAIGYAVEMVLEILFFGPEEYGLFDLEMKPYTWFVLISIIVTTPFQCAGEEFQTRALLPRLITAIIPHRQIGLALAALIPSTLFMLMHSASDPWLNINYFCSALLMWWLAYRTGGIEASIGLHIVNNFFSEWMMPFSDFSDMFERTEGSGSPVVIGYLTLELILVLIVDIIARRRGLVRMSSPAAATPEVMKPRQWFSIISSHTQVATKADLPRFDKTIKVSLEPDYVWAPQFHSIGVASTPGLISPDQPPGATWSPFNPTWAPPDPTSAQPVPVSPFATWMPTQSASPTPTGVPPEPASPTPTGVPLGPASPTPTGVPLGPASPTPTGVPPGPTSPTPTGVPPQSVTPTIWTPQSPLPAQTAGSPQSALPVQTWGSPQLTPLVPAGGSPPPVSPIQTPESPTQAWGSQQAEPLPATPETASQLGANPNSLLDNPDQRWADAEFVDPKGD